MAAIAAADSEFQTKEDRAIQGAAKAKNRMTDDAAYLKECMAQLKLCQEMLEDETKKYELAHQVRRELDRDSHAKVRSIIQSKIDALAPSAIADTGLSSPVVTEAHDVDMENEAALLCQRVSSDTDKLVALNTRFNFVVDDYDLAELPGLDGFAEAERDSTLIFPQDQ